MKLSDQIFLDSCSTACDFFYRANGLSGAITCLFNMLKQHIPLSRINAIMIDKGKSHIIHMFDTRANSRSMTRVLTDMGEVMLLEVERVSEPIIINDLEPYKNKLRRKLPSTTDVPFLHHSSLLRLPLFENDTFFFLLNFWSDVTFAFTEEHIGQLHLVTLSFSQKLVDNLTLTSIPETTTEISDTVSNHLLENTPGMSELLSRIKLVAPTSATVLILGETGVGKELVAEALHEASDRRDKTMLRINCGSITPSLITSELFGHEKGSFTSAHNTRKGFFEQANGGTIFLDEIGELSPEAQVHLLRVLENRVVTRVGGTSQIPVDVRVVAATHPSLEEKVRKGEFRQDLWYRLNVFPLHVPPLRNRRGDIPVLVQFFLKKFSARMQMDIPAITPEEIEKLYAYEWPGNVRELEFVVERSLILHRGKALGDAFIFDLKHEHERTSEWPTLAELEKSYIKKVLNHCEYKMTGPGSASDILGIHYTTLRARMLAMNMELPRQRRQ